MTRETWIAEFRRNVPSDITVTQIDDAPGVMPTQLVLDNGLEGELSRQFSLYLISSMINATTPEYQARWQVSYIIKSAQLLDSNDFRSWLRSSKYCDGRVYEVCAGG